MSGNPERIDTCLKVAYGGFLDNDNTQFDTYDPRVINDNSIRSHYSDGKTQSALYADRRLERKDNPYYAGFIDYLTNRLSTGIYFTGDGAEACKDFFNKTCPDAFMQLRLAIRSAVGNGPGFQYFYGGGIGKLKQIVTVDHDQFEIKLVENNKGTSGDKLEELTSTTSKGVVAKWIEITDTSSRRKFYMKNYDRKKPSDYAVEGNRLGVLRLIYDEKDPYGEPVGEASYLDLKAMKRLNRNIMAGLESNLSDFIKIGLDLDKFDDGEKPGKIKEHATNLKGIDWCAIDYLVTDKNVQMGRAGTYPGDGQGNESRMLETGKIIEPVLSSILFSYYVAIGLIEQTGANKSLIASQKKEAERGVSLLRDSVKVYFLTQMKPLITKKEVDLRYKPDLDSEDVVSLYVGGVISRSYAQEALGIIDDGEDFAEIVAADAMPKIPNSNSDNHDDNPTKKRNVPQSKGVGK